MKIWKTKVWGPVDLALVKWSSIFFGLIIGSFVPHFIREHLWFFVIVMVLLAIKPVMHYFSDKG